MSKRKVAVSFCFGAYNEEEILEKSLKKTAKALSEILGKNNYEIVVVENGSTDNTGKILHKIKDPKITGLNVGKKGYGLAMRTAIKKARYEHIVLTAVDLPFGFDDLREAMKYWEEYDLIFGSKAHPWSYYPSPLQRKISSKIYRFLAKLLFRVKIRDTQGSIFLKKSRIQPVLKHCNSDDAVFTLQLAIYAEKSGLKMKEIPVKAQGLRDHSQYNLLKDAPKMLKSMIKEYLSHFCLLQKLS